MNSIAITFLGSDYTYMHLIMLVIGGGIAVLLASSISRLAYFAYRSHLLLGEIQKDIRRLVIMQSQRYTAAEPTEPKPAQPPADTTPPEPKA